MGGNRAGRLFALMLGSEGLQSVFHFGLGFALIHILPAHDYGVFSILFLIAGVSLTYTRALASVPATIHLPRSRTRHVANVHDVVFGSAAAAIALAAGLAVGIGCWLWLRRPDVALGSVAFVAAWSLRSHLRIVCYARQRATLSSLGDGVFLVTGVLAAVIVLRGGAREGGADLLTQVLFLLAGAHGLAMLVVVVAERRPIRIAARRSIRRRYGAMRGWLTWSVISTTTSNAQMPAQMMFIAIVAGAAAYAPIGATLLLFAPLRLAAVALCNLVQPELSARLARGRWRDVRDLVRTSAGWMALGCLLFGVALALTFPVVEHRVLSKFAADHPLSLIAGLIWGATSLFTIYSVPRALLEAASAFKPVAILTAVSAVIGLAITAVLLRTTSPPWAVLGFTVSEGVIALCCWPLARRIVRPTLTNVAEGTAGAPTALRRLTVTPSPNTR